MPIITPPVVNAIDPTKIPNRSQDQVTFTTNADFTVGAWPTFQTQINSVASNVNNNATEAFNAATTATTKAAEALVSEANALTYQTGAQVAAAAAQSAAGLPSPAGNALKTLRVNAGGTSVEWASVGQVYRTARTSNTIITAADMGNLIDITSGTFTQTFAAASALGNGFYMYLRNSGTGDITLDPSGNEYFMDSELDQLKGIGLFEPSAWSRGGGWSVSGNSLVANNTIQQCQPSASNPFGYGSSDTVVGRTYLITYTLSNVTKGVFRVNIGGAFGAERTTDGTFTDVIVATTTSGLLIQPKVVTDNFFTGQVSNLTVVETFPSFIMYPGECRLVQCDGTALRSVVLNSFHKTFTASGTFVKPPGYAAFGGLLWSAGASGNSQYYSGVGGGGGGCFPLSIPATIVANTVAVTIGAGGVGTVLATANAGGNSSFGSLLTVYGASASGTGGAIEYSTPVANAPGGGFNSGSPGGANTFNAVWGGGSSNAGSSSRQGSSIYGGGAGGSIVQDVVMQAGTSKMAGNGGSSSRIGDAQNGTAPGGGGGAASGNGTFSGSGARGELRIWGLI